MLLVKAATSIRFLRCSIRPAKRSICQERSGITLEDIAEQIKSMSLKNIVVMAGAGISTPSGIPDFRTPGSGLYSNLQKYNLPYAEAIFDLDYFSMDPRAFFALAKELYPGRFRPNAAHYFGKLLYDKGILRRFYTQNIDGLERLSGISPEFIVEAHGSFSTASCTRCRMKYLAQDIKEQIFNDKIPHCTKEKCKGVIKPDIVFFGEMLPDRFFLFREDLFVADLLIVMGTSLVVHPFAGIAEEVSKTTPRLLINNELVGSFCYRHNDLAELGDIIDGVKKLVELIGWQKDLENLMKS